MFTDYGEIICTFYQAKALYQVHYAGVFALPCSEDVHHCHVIPKGFYRLSGPVFTPDGR